MTTYLLLELNGYSVGLLEEDSITPEIISEGGKLMELPLAESPGGKGCLPFGPVAV